MENERLNTIEDFAAYVKEHIFDDVPEMAENHKVDLKEVLKNNGIKLQGITIQETDTVKETNIFPTIYLEDAFEKYQDGDTLSELMADLRASFEAHKNPKDIDVGFMKDFKQVAERLSIKVINYDMNRDFLEGTPHFKYGDLAAIFQVQMNMNEYGTMTATVKNEQLKMWGVTAADLLTNATRNMEEKQPPHITSMFEVLKEMMGMDIPGMPPMDGPEMYVMSNESKMNGAAGIIFTDRLQEFAEEKGSDIYIIPSSIHELILIPAAESMGAQDIKQMVREVNDTQLDVQDRLSYNVYLYSKEEKQLMIADTKEPLKLEDPGKKQDKEKPKSIKDRLEEGKAKSAAKALEPKPEKAKNHQKVLD